MLRAYQKDQQERLYLKKYVKLCELKAQKLTILYIWIWIIDDDVVGAVNLEEAMTGAPVEKDVECPL